MHAKALCYPECGAHSSLSTQQNTVITQPWVLTDVSAGAASVSRTQSQYTAPPHPLDSSFSHCSVDHQGLLTSARPLSNSNAAECFKDLTITAGLFNVKPRLTSSPLSVPAFSVRKKIGLMFLGAICSQPSMWNNTGVTSCVERQQIHFCTAVLIATYKQRHYSCPNFLLIYYALRCIVFYFLLLHKYDGMAAW